MNTQKAEFWLCLSRAFLAPVTGPAQTALREYLVPDLQELATVLAYPVNEHIADLKRDIEALPDGEAALVLYSRLFLVPGTRHPHINTCVYFDGAIHGDTVRKLTECYRACGLDKNEAVSDLPDHVTIQLEFAARLFGAAAARLEDESTAEPPLSAGNFVSAFVARWAPLFRQDMEQASGRFELSGNPWLHLSRILETVAAVEAGADKTIHVEPAVSEIEQLRKQYAGRMPGAAELAQLRAKLEEQGLSSNHLATPLPRRDAAEGLVPLSPPQPPRHTLPVE